MLRRGILNFSVRCGVTAHAVRARGRLWRRNITKEKRLSETGSRIASHRPVVQESYQDRIGNHIKDCMMSAEPAARTASYLKVLSAGAVKYVVTDFAPKFARATGGRVEFTFG